VIHALMLNTVKGIAVLELLSYSWQQGSPCASVKRNAKLERDFRANLTWCVDVGGTDGKPIKEIWCERVKMGSFGAGSETEGCGLDLCRMPVFCAYGNELGGQIVDHASDNAEFSDTASSSSVNVSSSLF
jgi:hypothetical protein